MEGLDIPEMGVYAYPEFEHVIHDLEGETAAAGGVRGSTLIG